MWQRFLSELNVPCFIFNYFQSHAPLRTRHSVLHPNPQGLIRSQVWRQYSTSSSFGRGSTCFHTPGWRVYTGYSYYVGRKVSKCFCLLVLFQNHLFSPQSMAILARYVLPTFSESLQNSPINNVRSHYFRMFQHLHLLICSVINARPTATKFGNSLPWFISK